MKKLKQLALLMMGMFLFSSVVASCSDDDSNQVADWNLEMCILSDDVNMTDIRNVCKDKEELEAFEALPELKSAYQKFIYLACSTFIMDKSEDMVMNTVGSKYYPQLKLGHMSKKDAEKLLDRKCMDFKDDYTSLYAAYEELYAVSKKLSDEKKFSKLPNADGFTVYIYLLTNGQSEEISELTFTKDGVTVKDLM